MISRRTAEGSKSSHGPGPARPVFRLIRAAFDRKDGIREPAPTSISVDFDLNLNSDRLERLLGLWRDRLPIDGKLPPRAAFDPLDMREHLGWLAIAEVVPDRSDVVFRLVGTHLVDLSGRDATGLRSADAHSPEAAAILRQIIDEPRPLRVAGPLEHRNKAFLYFECLLLPLADDGVTVDRLLFGLHFGATDLPAT